MKKELTTLFTGRHHTFLPEIDSTNTYLAGILRNTTLPEGFVLRAGIQTAGRGQKGSVWESEGEKNLLLSFLFYPSFLNTKEIFLLNKTFALAVFDFIKFWLEKNISIKWPNDIYWNNKKISGILIENSINAAVISHCIAGIGININQKIFPAGFLNPSSFVLVNQKEYDLDELFISLCSSMEARYLQLKKGDKKSIDQDYHSVLFALGKWKTYESREGAFQGCIQGVDETGKLLIETKESEIKKYDLKEIKFIDP